MKRAIFASFTTVATLTVIASPALADPGCYLITESGVKISLERICYTSEEAELLRRAEVLNQAAEDLDEASADYRSSLIDLSGSAVTAGDVLLIDRGLDEVNESFELADRAQQIADIRQAAARESFRRRRVSSFASTSDARNQTVFPELIRESGLTQDQIAPLAWAALQPPLSQ